MEYTQEIDYDLVLQAQKASGISDSRIVIENALRSYILSYSSKPPLGSAERSALVKSLTGSLHQYANPALRSQEKDAWFMAVREKYAAT